MVPILLDRNDPIDFQKIVCPVIADGVLTFYISLYFSLKDEGLGKALYFNKECNCISAEKIINEYAEYSVRLLCDGQNDFFYDFYMEYEYQKYVNVGVTEKEFTGLFLVKLVSKLVRSNDFDTLYYLIQRHASAKTCHDLQIQMTERKICNVSLSEGELSEGEFVTWGS